MKKKDLLTILRPVYGTMESSIRLIHGKCWLSLSVQLSTLLSPKLNSVFSVCKRCVHQNPATSPTSLLTNKTNLLYYMKNNVSLSVINRWGSMNGKTLFVLIICSGRKIFKIPIFIFYLCITPGWGSSLWVCILHRPISITFVGKGRGQAVSGWRRYNRAGHLVRSVAIQEIFPSSIIKHLVDLCQSCNDKESSLSMLLFMNVIILSGESLTPTGLVA